jgi:hypothetical protein
MIEDQAAADIEAPVPSGAVKDPMVLAAQTMVREIFNIAAVQMPELLKLQNPSPANAEIEKFTSTMIAQLQAQVTRALGVDPEDDVERTK